MPKISVRFVPLSPAVLQALLDGDLVAARIATGVLLTDWFVSDDITWLWRMRLEQIAAGPESLDQKRTRWA